MPRPGRLLLAGVLVTLAEAALGVFALSTLGPAEIAIYPIACAAATGLVIGLSAHLVRRRRPGDDHDSGGDGAGGGPQPPWWPEFEADFWRRVRERERVPA
jgi:hypothetical protein